MTYIALHIEKWLYGSTRMELKPEERACFTDILARAAITGADPPGIIFFNSEEHLAGMLQDPLDLVHKTLEKCKRFKKIKTNFDKREERYKLSVVNWEKYQHVYLHQRAYRQREKAKKEAQKKPLNDGTKKDNQNITGYNRDIVGEEDRRGEDRDIRKEDKILNGEDTKGDPSHPSNRFYSLLEEFSNSHPYPFDKEKDHQTFDPLFEKYPDIDFVAELSKKIGYWKENPGALKSRGKNARTQLFEFLFSEVEFQKQ